MGFVYFTCKIDSYEAKLFDALVVKKKVSRTELLREIIKDYLNKNLNLETNQEQIQTKEPQKTEQQETQPETQPIKEEQPSEAQTNQQGQPNKEIEIDLEYIKDDFRPRTLEEMIPKEI